MGSASPRNPRVRPVCLAEWDRLVALLVPSRVFTKAEGGCLIVACTAISQLIQCQTFLKKKKSLSYDATAPGGGTHYKPYPEVSQRNVARKQYQSALSDLGLNPSSRSKVKALPAKSESGLKRLLG